MAPICSLLAKLAESPVVQSILVPSIVKLLSSFFESTARKLEIRSAVRAAKAAKKAEELRDASKRLSDSTRR